MQVIMKMLSYVLNHYIHQLGHHLLIYKIHNLQIVPVVEDDDAVSVSCLDLSYSVTYNARTKEVTNEQDDKGQIFVLEDLSSFLHETQDTEKVDGGSKSKMKLVCTIIA